MKPILQQSPEELKANALHAFSAAEKLATRFVQLTWKSSASGTMSDIKAKAEPAAAEAVPMVSVATLMNCQAVEAIRRQ
ncbi:hypothetical protein OAH18_01730 [bacterium]|nr:hypothetical protein [bacterium]